MSLQRGFRGGLGHLGEDVSELFQAGGRNDDGLVTSSDVFRNSQETASRIFFQGEQKRFAFYLDFFGFEGVFAWSRTRPLSAGETTGRTVIRGHNISPLLSPKAVVAATCPRLTFREESQLRNLGVPTKRSLSLGCVTRQK